jgi:hypothetical protein
LDVMLSSSIAASNTGGPPDAEALFGALYSELHRRRDGSWRAAAATRVSA